MLHALTVDVEDYQNVLAREYMGSDGPPTEAVVRNTERLLELFAEHRVRATFFILGEVASTFPNLMRRIVAEEHEIGVHGFYHRQVFKLTPEKFRREVVDGKSALEDAAGTAAHGHRAPAFSIVPETRWALDVLVDAGFLYDASIYPISGRRYGWPGFRQDIHRMALPDGREIIEAPTATVSVFGKRLPCCGGGYLRHFPVTFTRWAMRRIQRERPAVVYVHPYDIDDKTPMPEIAGLSDTVLQRVQRHHRGQVRNRSTVLRKIVRLLSEFEFGPLGDVIERVLGQPAVASRTEPPRST